MKPDKRHPLDTNRWPPTAVVVALAAITTWGCGLPEWARDGAKVGPNYKPPPVAVAQNWIDYQDPRVKSEEQDLSHWWEVFDDPALNSLLNEASEQNLSLRAAGERIMEARARRG